MKKKNLPRAAHLENFNFFDNVGIDIQKSHAALDEVMPKRRPEKSPSRSKIRNVFRLKRDLVINRLGLLQFFIFNGIYRDWFVEFCEYWTHNLRCRPLEVYDFFFLHFHYRLKAQYTSELDWSSPDKHLENWQQPEHIYGVLSNIRTSALFPFSGVDFRRYVKKNSRILEYGCSHAPSYRAYRRYCADLMCRFTLFDIEQYSFHYSKYSYWDDVDIESFHTLKPENFSNPFLGLDEKFDAIILHNVLEHVDNPLNTLQHIRHHLKDNGILFFDYIKSDALGQDTLAGLEQRPSTLSYINEHFDILEGELHLDGRSVGKIVSRKKRES